MSSGDEFNYYEVEFSFENTPGDPTSEDGGHTTFDIVDSTATMTMTFPDGFVLKGEAEGPEEDDHPPYNFAKEYEFIFDCSTMAAHVFTDQNVTINASGTLTDGHTFSGSGVITTYP